MSVLLITGASSGIGLQTALRAAAAGWDLCLVARDASRLQTAAAQVADAGAEPVAVTADVADAPAVEDALARTLERFGRLDAVFANAGVGAPRGFTSSTPERWREMVLTNVLGTALTIRASLPALRERRGHLVLTSSIAGRQALAGSLYSATKHAVGAMADSVRDEVAGSGVRVTVVEPGTVNTPYFATPPPGALQPDDIARAVMQALSEPPGVELSELFIRPTTQRN